MEEAAGYQQLMARFGHTQEKLAEALGKSRSHIANLTRLLTLPPEVRTWCRMANSAPGHARTLVGLPNAKELADQIVAKGLSVRDAERPRIPGKARAATAKETRRPACQGRRHGGAGNDLMAAIRMKVSINHIDGTEGGTISITYNTLEQLDDICRALSGG